MKNPDWFRPTVAEVRLQHLRHNCRILRSLVSADTFFCPMVKASAYGHGDLEVTRTLVDEGITHVGVALVEEGRRLRAAGFDDVEILVFSHFDETAAEGCLQFKLTPVISQWEEIKHFENLHRYKDPLPVHIKINTGMYRMGFALNELSKLGEYFKNSSKLSLQGVCTHLSDGEEVKRTEEQFEKFAAVAKVFGDNIFYHTLNSAGVLSHYLERWQRPQNFLGVRPGIALYGIEPELENLSTADREKLIALDLKPVLSLKTQLVHFHHVPAGERVSYGGIWQAKRKSVVGVVPIGYADGYFRQFSNNGVMLINGLRVPVVGTVCMDYVLLDLTEVWGERGVEVGSDVVVYGRQGQNFISTQEMAARVGTVAYELLTNLSARVPRVYLEE